MKHTCGSIVSPTFAFLDSGSFVSLIDKKVADQLKANGPIESLCLGWTNDVRRKEKESRRIALNICGTSKSKSYEIKNIRTVNDLNLFRQSLSVPELSERFPHIKNLPLTSYKDVQPRVLIGLNNNHVSVPLRVKEGCINELIAIKTRHGWTIRGITNPTSESTNKFNIHYCFRQTPDDNHQLQRKTYDIDDTVLSYTNCKRSKVNKIASKSPEAQGSHSKLARISQV